MVTLRHLAGSALLALAACGGGGSSTPQQRHTISGTIAAAAGQVVDGDVADVNAARTPNDDFASAQPLPSAVTVGGHVGAADTRDDYRVRLAAGQVVTLAIADPGAADLDLFLYAATTPPTLIDSSVGAIGTAVESLTVAVAGDYYVEVQSVELSPAGPVGSSAYLLTLGAGAAGAQAPALTLAREFVPGEVVVRFRSGLPGAAAATDPRARVAAMGLRVLAAAPGREALLSLGDGGPAGRLEALRALGAPAASGGAAALVRDEVTSAKLDTLRALKALRAREDVETADPNYVFQPSLVPADPAYKFQWHYPLINLPQAWDVVDGTGVIVAVIDTGVYLAHPDLPAARRVGGYDFISDAARARDGDGIDPDPDDPGDSAAPGQSSFHGTHVAGTVAAARDGAGVVGVAFGARIMPIRALGQGGGTSFDIMQGLRFAARLSNASGTLPPQRADVANLSLGCLGCFSATEQAVYAEVRAAGLIVVAAAGNENSATPSYPASYEGVISVSAVDMQSAKAPYSNTGPTVDLAAPGGNSAADRDGNGYPDGVLSTVADDSSGTRQPAWRFLQGTSMAAPHLAGVVALMKSRCPALTPASLDAFIAGGLITRDLGPAGRDDVFGVGLVDSQKAVAACTGAAPATLGVAPGRLDAGALPGPFTVTASVVGGALPPVTATSSASWLTVTQTPPVASGIGAWSIAVARTGLPDGSYAASVTFQAGAGQTVVVPVTMRVGSTAASTGVGFLYVLLLDASGTPRAQDDVAALGGSYAFSFTGVPAGTYTVVAGTDLDDDGFICDAGEACGAWPTLGVVTEFEVTGDRPGLDFGVGFNVGVGALSAGAPASKPGLHRLPAPKALGGGR